MKREFSIMAVLLFVIGSMGCKFLAPEPCFGREYNSVRDKLGIPPIPDNWVMDDDTVNGTGWNNPDADKKFNAHIPVHYEKGVTCRGGALISELDRYYGRNDYPSTDPDYYGSFNREKLEMIYYYRIDENDYKKRLGWSITYYDQDFHEINLEDAKKILEEWDIPFP